MLILLVLFTVFLNHGYDLAQRHSGIICKQQRAYVITPPVLCCFNPAAEWQPALLESLARLAASPRADGLQRQIQDGLSRSRSLLCDYNDLKRHQEKGDGSKPPALANPGLEYDAKKHDECIMDVEVHNMSAFHAVLRLLYISFLLQQATTGTRSRNGYSTLYISFLLQQATTIPEGRNRIRELYISFLLQQATT